MDPAQLVASINARHGTGLELVGRFAGGEGSGASELRDADGSRWVLKAVDGTGLDHERAARTTERLRALGYPAPATRLTDWTIRHHDAVVAEFFVALGLDLLTACGAQVGM